MSAIEIFQDYDADGGGPMATFWAKGHGHDDRDFIRSVLDYCLYHDVDIPAIATHDEPVETWQQNISREDEIEYRRYPDPPTSPRSPRFPITILDLEGVRRHGGTACSVDDCHEPWFVGSPVRVQVEPDPGKIELGSPYMAVRLWLCREHRRRLPEPFYRLCLIPVGATILLPATPTHSQDDGR